MTLFKFKTLLPAAAVLLCAAIFQPSLALAEKDGHNHDDHAGHGHSHEGKPEDLGTTMIGSLKVIARQLGKVEAGKESIFAVELGDGALAPKAVRLWIGTATGAGSVKTKADKVGKIYDGHVETPKTLTADSRFWVEIQPEKGPKAKTSFALKRE